MSRICTKCRAEVPDTTIVCEYCGTSLPELSSGTSQTQNGSSNTPTSKVEDLIKKTNAAILKMNQYAAPAYKIIGFEATKITEAESVYRELTVFASENKKAMEIAAELKTAVEAVKRRMHTHTSQKGGVRILVTIAYFIAFETVLGLLIWLGNTVPAENLNTYLVGGLAIIGGLIGLLGAIVGVIAGLIVGGLVGLLFTWLMTSFVGNIILAILWNAIFIPIYFAVIRHKIDSI